MPSPSFLARTLFLFATLSSVLVPGVSAGRLTKCKVKPKAQGVLIAQPPVSTSPASAIPTTTQELGATNSSLASATPSATLIVQQALPPFDYGTRKVRGVNLGGWFMMEPWITPSMFEKTGNDGIVDEYTFGQYQDRSKAEALLHEHWSTWYTEQDFIDIANVGLNHVRIPMSYWCVPMSQDTGPYIPGAWPYVLQALDWARAHGLYVIFDLHGAPGSQNGFDNSGQRTSDPYWGLDQDSINRTVEVLGVIASEVGDKVSVIQLLNEVAGFRGDQWANAVRGFWQAAYDKVRANGGSDVKVMIGDAFLGVGNWDGYMKSAHNVIMDLHVYQIFSTGELQRSWDDHVSFMCNRANEFTGYASANLWLVMGEWSTAMTDCAKYLNGRGVGARWDGSYYNSQYLGSCEGLTGSYRTFSEEYKTALRKYWEAQVEVAERVTGWVFWTWKAENADDWSYQKGVEAGFIPRNPDDRMFPNICG